MFSPNAVHHLVALRDLPSEAEVILFHGNEILLSRDGARGGRLFLSPAEAAGAIGESVLYAVGTLHGTPCAGAELTRIPEPLPSGLFSGSARSMLAEVSGDERNALCRARELVFWLNRHRFCGKCGGRTEMSNTDTALVCPDCRTRYYPQIAPAVIVAVTRNGGGEILLAHNRNFEKDVYSLIAGFVESGETAEDAVYREVLEESGIRVRNVRYLSSQPWPFPNSLMLAFRAELDSGEAFPDGAELDSLGWFTRDRLPALPGPGSIAASIIARWKTGKNDF